MNETDKKLLGDAADEIQALASIARAIGERGTQDVYDPDAAIRLIANRADELNTKLWGVWERQTGLDDDAQPETVGTVRTSDAGFDELALNLERVDTLARAIISSAEGDSQNYVVSLASMLRHYLADADRIALANAKRWNGGAS